MTTEQLRTFLAQRPALSLRALEKEARLPTRTLQRIVGGRDLPPKHVPALLAVLAKYGWTGAGGMIGNEYAALRQPLVSGSVCTDCLIDIK